MIFSKIIVTLQAVKNECKNKYTMLNSLKIANFRRINSLTVNSLRRVNLITGKNNTGKSTILEAIAIYATKGDFSNIFQLLTERGEYFRQNETTKNITDYNIKSLSSLFTNRIVSYENDKYISIGNLEGVDGSNADNVILRFAQYYDHIQKDIHGITTQKRITFTDEFDKNVVNYKVGFEIKSNNNSKIFSLDEERPFRFGYRDSVSFENFQFIRTGSIDRELNGKLWDNIALTEKEQYVIDALKIIEPTTERIAFVDENSRERVAKIKLSGSQSVLPLKSMGDGINRVLTIILALINSDKGFLLIDEFENGLHHSVQEKLWKIIFDLSQKLNVQVFVTTHSNDCIRSFENVLSNESDVQLGQLIRLDNINGSIQQVTLDVNELNIAIDNNIEIR